MGIIEMNPVNLDNKDYRVLFYLRMKPLGIELFL